MRGTIRAGTDELPDEQRLPLRAVAEPARVRAGHSGRGRRATSSFYLTTALGSARRRRSRPTSSTPSRVTPASFERRSVVILNDATALPTQTDELLKRFVEQGGGLFVVLGERTPWSGDVAAPAGQARRAGRSHRGAAAARSAISTTAIRSSSSSRIRRNGNFANVAVPPVPRAARRRRPTACWRGSTTARRRWSERRVGSGPRDRVHVHARRLVERLSDAAMFLPLVHETMTLSGAVRGAGGVVHRRPDARHLGAARPRSCARAARATPTSRRAQARAASSWRRPASS